MHSTRAAVSEAYGSPSVLQIKNVEKPIPKDNEVLIRVYATTVNRTDCAMLSAKPFIMRFFTGLLKPNNPIQGTDFAGKVEAVGISVTLLKVGDKVFGLDDSGLSSHAEYMTICEKKALALMPNNFTYAEAAACLEGAHYAYNFINKVNLKAGQKILVNGATGAIGSALVQLLRFYGANITAVCNTKNLELVKSLGADQVVDYTKEDFTKRDDKYSFVFDAVGKSSFSKCKPLLEKRGIYISSELGYMVQNPFLALITPILGGKKVIFPIPVKVLTSVQLVKRLMEEGKFKAVIDRQYILEDIAAAYVYVGKGEKTGNVVITIGDEANGICNQ
ncbi:MAG: alcohol dehydrogenase zinc-binding protein [Daejeonella sp.]|nr:alcohol dehydrogenase zinc-binding protein [Daejeonella sp.]